MHWVHRHIIPQAYSSLPLGIERRLLEQLPPLEQSPSPPSAGLGFQLGGGGHTKICSQQRPFGLLRCGVRGGRLFRPEHVLWPQRSLSCVYTRPGRHERVRSGAYRRRQGASAFAATGRRIRDPSPALTLLTPRERRRSLPGAGQCNGAHRHR